MRLSRLIQVLARQIEIVGDVPVMIALGDNNAVDPETVEVFSAMHEGNEMITVMQLKMKDKPDIDIALKAQKIMRETEMHAIPVGPVGANKWATKTAEGRDMPIPYILTDPTHGKRDCPHKAIVDAYEWLESQKAGKSPQPSTPEQVAKT